MCISNLIPDSHADCEVGGENKHTGGDMEDSWLSNNEVDDSDMDKDYVPNSDVSSSDSDLFNPSTSNKVWKKFTKKNDNGNQSNETLGVLENDLYLTSDGELNELTPRNNDSCRKVKNKTSIAQKGRIRVRNPDAWLCNVRKQKLASGEEYISKKGKTVAAKVMKPPCSCRLKCYERLSNDEIQKFLKQIGTKKNVM